MELSINTLSIKKAKRIRKKKKNRIKRDLVKRIKAREKTIIKELYRSCEFEDTKYNSLDSFWQSKNSGYLILRFIGLKISKSKKTGFIKNSESGTSRFTKSLSYKLILTLK